MAIRKPTIQSHLRDGLDMPMKRLPFGRLILIYAPEEADVDSAMTAQEVFASFERDGFNDYLSMKLEDLVLADEMRKTRQIARFAFYTGLVASLIAVIIIGMVSYQTKEYPHWAVLAPPLIIPGFIMWKQVGLFNADNARGIADILSVILPWNRRRDGGYDDRDSYQRNGYRRYRDDGDDYPSQERYQETESKSTDQVKTSNNGNPYS